MNEFNGFNIDLVKERAKDYVFSLYSTSSPSFKLCGKSPKSTSMSTSFAILCLELIEKLDFLSDKEKEYLALGYLKTLDPETGLFIDPLLNLNLTDKQDLFSSQYLTIQNTCFTLSALDALNYLPGEFHFIDNLRNEKSITQWLKNLNWGDPWLESNKVMFLLQLLSYEAIAKDSSSSLNLVHAALDWLDKLQDPNTGFWGTNKGAPLFHGMAGSFHIYLFYFYFERKINYIERIIDNTLVLQARDGLFYPLGGGGACEDLDAIDILVKFSKVTNYREKQIKKALLNAFNAVASTQNNDGGFPWAIRPRCSVPLWIKFANPFHPASNIKMTRLFVRSSLAFLNKRYKEPDVLEYSNWKEMAFRISESDIWSTWFRLLALIMIADRYKADSGVTISRTYRSKPGLGYHF